MQDASGNAGRGGWPGQASAAAERSPRRLTTHQKAVLIQVLLAFPEETVAVRYLTSASDALNYADDFSTIFKAVNWTVVSAEPAEDLAHCFSGLTIVVREEKLPPSAEALRDALRIYGIEAEVARDRSNLCGASNFALAVTQP
ncbi:MAG: hypothetical protein QOG55_2379 [Acidobacteriaceae bacterium]|jgi:hypothetical protein|nr:hypothetical protein [Acidobacteriaceae bacterium]